MSIATTTTNTADLHVRIDAKIKEEAENVLARLGVSPSNAVSMFYRQVMLKRGLPFQVTLENQSILDYDTITPEKLKEELARSKADYEAGRVYTVDEVFAEMK